MGSYSSIFPISSGGGGSIAGFEWAERTADFTAEANKAYYCDTALGDILLTLPSNPAPGDEVAFLIIGANKLNITTTDKIKGAALTTDFVKQVSQEYLMVVLFYVDSTTGWNWNVRYDSYLSNAYIGAGDPLFGNVVLLLKGDGTNNSTSIVDSSPSPKAVTVNGNAIISTARSKYGGSSIFTGSTGYLSVYGGIDFNMGPGSWALDTWFFFATHSNYPGIFTNVNNNNNANGNLRILNNSAGFLAVATGVSNNVPFVPNQWNHLAVVKDAQASTFKTFLNGTQATSVSDTFSYSFSTLCEIGRIPSYPGNVYLDSFRITKALPRFTSNFDVNLLIY